MTDINWTPVYDVHKLKPGTSVLFRYGTGPKEPVELAHLIMVNDVLQVVSANDNWAYPLTAFTALGTLSNLDGSVAGRLFRQCVVEIPDKFLSPQQKLYRKCGGEEGESDNKEEKPD